MSTVIATYGQFDAAHAATLRLLREGVGPDALSLVSFQATPEGQDDQISSVGDSSYLVGGPDDPEPRLDAPVSADYSEFTTIEASPISGIDTSDSDLNVETVDQAEDSQELVDRDTYDPPISQGEHEREDLNLTLLTGFPTIVPINQDRSIDETELQEQYAAGLDLLVPEGGGRVYGGGSLATAALSGIANSEGLHGFLRQEGISPSDADEVLAALRNGGAVLAIEIVPGVYDEAAVERIAEESGAESIRLFDAPRFYDHDRASS